MYFSILGSSSSGNCSVFFDEKKLILLDCGHSYKYIRERLCELSLSNRKVDCIILTHEHIDHVRSLRTFISRENPIIFATNGTMLGAKNGLKIESGKFEIFKAGDEFSLNGVKIKSFPIPHDTPEPCGFSFEINGMKMSYVLDIGYISEIIKFNISGSKVLVIESNYDDMMLLNGPYPVSTKYRIKSRIGHLDNNLLAKFFKTDFDGESEKIFLAHISRNNNTPEIALKSARSALKERFIKRTFSIKAVSPKGVSEIIKF